MVTADDVLVAVVTVDQGPDGIGVLASDEGKFLARGFKKTAWSVAKCPACVGVDVIGDEWILLVEFVFGNGLQDPNAFG